MIKNQMVVEVTCPICKQIRKVQLHGRGEERRCLNCSGIEHGAARRRNRTPEYRSWNAMRQRCHNRKNARYHSYGGCGITVCERWDKFENFLADMGPRPKGTSLDRFPNKWGNYEPANCRWATPKQQQNNMRSNILLTLGEETKTLVDWSKVLHIKADTLRCRYKRGWSTERILKEGLYGQKKAMRHTVLPDMSAQWKAWAQYEGLHPKLRPADLEV